MDTSNKFSDMLFVACLILILIFLTGCSSDPCVSDFRKGALAICEPECDPKKDKCVWEY